jgi:WXG100 family type VII secretion target
LVPVAATVDYRQWTAKKGVREVSKSALDPAELARIAGKFESNSNQIEEQLRVIQGWVEQTRPAWGGAAGMGYQSVHEMWGTQQARLIRLLRETAESVRDYANVSVTATDEASAAVRIPLPLDNRAV